MAQLLQDANTAFVEEDYELALKLYTEYVDQHSDDAIALAARAGVYLKVGKSREALQDASAATKIKLDYEIAFYRKGLAAFALSEYELAKQAFERGLALFQEAGNAGNDSATRKYRTWIRKCDVEIENDDGQEAALTSKENVATVPNKEAAAGAGTGANGTSSSSSSSTTKAPIFPPSKPVTQPPFFVPSEPSIKYQYYQTASHITVTVLQKNVKPEDATITIQPRQLKVVLKKEGGHDVTVLDKPLFDEVAVDECTTKFFGTKVEIKLKKVSAYQWGDLVGSAASAPSAPARQVASSGVAAGITSSIAVENGGSSQTAGNNKALRPYASHRNWEQVEKEISKELEKDPVEGEDALNKLFKDIYAKGTDETRRAMIKSFQTSGGTVLSTNWKEVAKKDYEKEKTAPEGMEWQTWEGKKLKGEETKEK